MLILVSHGGCCVTFLCMGYKLYVYIMLLMPIVVVTTCHKFDHEDKVKFTAVDWVSKKLQNFEV